MLSPEEILEEVTEEASADKSQIDVIELLWEISKNDNNVVFHTKLATIIQNFGRFTKDIEEGTISSGEGGDGDYAISKNIAEETDEADSEVDSLDNVSPEIEVVEEFGSDVEEVEEFTQAAESIPEKKVSVSIEELRKKMSEDKEN